jgi:hypothetical protein
MENKSELNWFNDYAINENIKENVSMLIGAYSRLSYANPDHIDVLKWENQSTKWNNFRINMPSLLIYSKGEAENLINEIASELKAVHEFEDNINK